MRVLSNDSSQVGQDAFGKLIIDELNHDGIDTSFVVVSEVLWLLADPLLLPMHYESNSRLISHIYDFFSSIFDALFLELNQLNPCKDIECSLPNQYYFSSFELETDLLQGLCFLNGRGFIML